MAVALIHTLARNPQPPREDCTHPLRKRSLAGSELQSEHISFALVCWSSSAFKSLKLELTARCMGAPDKSFSESFHGPGRYFLPTIILLMPLPSGGKLPLTWNLGHTMHWHHQLTRPTRMRQAIARLSASLGVMERCKITKRCHRSPICLKFMLP